jgi:hypothetical protein
MKCSDGNGFSFDVGMVVAAVVSSALAVIEGDDDDDDESGVFSPSCLEVVAAYGMRF